MLVIILQSAAVSVRILDAGEKTFGHGFRTDDNLEDMSKRGKGGDGSDFSDSEEDEEALLRLREAVDPESLKSNVYEQKPRDGDDRDSHTFQHPENPDEFKDSKEEENKHDDPRILYLTAKRILEKNRNLSTKPSSKSHSSLKSLRRDKQSEETHKVISELEVTPQFQKYVGSKLDELLSNQIRDSNPSEQISESKNSGGDAGLKLLTRSKTIIKNADYDFVINKATKKPDLLAHKRVKTTEEDLESVAVSGVKVLSQEDTRAWVNKFPDRVEPGIERIKKKKKKSKKKIQHDVDVLR